MSEVEELASLAEKLSTATKNMREEAKQKEADLAATAEKVEKECQEMRDAAQADCDAMRNMAESELAAMLTAAHEEATAMREKQQEEQADWANEKKSIARGPPFEGDTVTFSIGGTSFSMHTSNLKKRHNSKTLLAALLSGRHQIEAGTSGQPIFIDRDPQAFRYIMQYIRDPKKFRLPKDQSEVEQLVVEGMAYIMPPAFFGKLEGEYVVQFTAFNTDSIHVPKPPNSWNQRLAPTMFDDDEAPVILHFDGKNEGVVQFNVGEPFCKLQIRNGKGMKFDIEMLDGKSWKKVAEYRLDKTGWNAPVEWKSRRSADAWRLVLKKNTEKNWLQNFRWWKLRETTTWMPHAWAKPYISEDDVKHLRRNALYEFHHG